MISQKIFLFLGGDVLISHEISLGGTGMISHKILLSLRGSDVIRYTHFCGRS